MSGNVKLALSHVVPDLVLKVLKGQDPLHILGDGRPGPALHLRRRPRPRHPPRDGVAGGRQRRLQPLDRGDRRPSSSWPSASGTRSTPTAGRSTTSATRPFEHDVQLRVPDVRKAKDGPRLRGDDVARADARRGHPVDPRRGRRPAACDPVADMSAMADSKPPFGLGVLRFLPNPTLSDRGRSILNAAIVVLVPAGRHGSGPTSSSTTSPAT